MGNYEQYANKYENLDDANCLKKSQVSKTNILENLHCRCEFKKLNL